MSGAKTIVPWRFQVPPRPKVVSDSIRGCSPPLASTIFSLLSAKKPSRVLSGDQNGTVAPSVPDNCCSAPVESERTHKLISPFGPTATKASRFPSGDNAALLTRKDQVFPGQQRSVIAR